VAKEEFRQGNGRKRGGRKPRRKEAEEVSPYIEKIVKINRVAKVVKGGRRFSFSVYGVVGDGAGRVGVGLGKANLVPDAIKKALERAKLNMINVPVTKKGTIPYKVIGKFGAGRVTLKPASPGTGVIAGGAVRAVLEALGVTDVLTKSGGSNNPSNVLRATMEGLGRLRTPGQIAKLRGLTIQEVFHGAGYTPEQADREEKAE